MSDRNISDLRAALFDALQQVKAGTMDLDKARAVNELSKTLIDSAKVEVEYLRVAGEGESAFLSPSEDDDSLAGGLPGRTVHRLR